MFPVIAPFSVVSTIRRDVDLLSKEVVGCIIVYGDVIAYVLAGWACHINESKRRCWGGAGGF